MFKIYRTMTGLTMQMALEKLDESLPKAAYKTIGGSGLSLTDISPPHLQKLLCDVYGVQGYGWWYTYESDDMIIDPNHVLYLRDTNGDGVKETPVIGYQVIIKKLLFYTAYDYGGVRMESEPVIATGADQNEKVQFAMKGAVTNAIGAAASRLGAQLSVYAGLRNVKSYETPSMFAAQYPSHNKIWFALLSAPRDEPIGVTRARMSAEFSDFWHFVMRQMPGIARLEQYAEEIGETINDMTAQQFIDLLVKLDDRN